MDSNRKVEGVAVYDFNWYGHIPAYHKLCVEAACRADIGPVVSFSGRPQEVRKAVQSSWPASANILQTPYCPELGRPLAQDSFLRFLHRFPGGFSLWSWIRTNARLRRRHALRRWTTGGQLLNRLEGIQVPRLVLLPYLDDMLESALSPADVDRALGPRRWTGIFMQASDLRSPPLRGRVKDRLPLLNANSCRGIGVIDETAGVLLRKALPGKNVTFIPDVIDSELPNETPPVVEELRRRAHGRKVIGLFGHLNRAKNLELFLQLAMQPSQRDLFFVIAGQFERLGVDPSSVRLLEQAAAGRWENILALPHRIASEGDFNALLSSTDLVFAVYRDFTRSSNILSKAVRWRRPILVADGYCMGERVRSYGIGACVKTADTNEWVETIRRLLVEPLAPEGFDRYSNDFSLVRFQEQVADLLRAAIIDS